MFEIMLEFITDFCQCFTFIIPLILIMNLISDLLWGGK